MSINPNISWLSNNQCIVVYYHFRFHFFKGKPYKWLKILLSNSSEKETSKIPREFTNYLFERKILIS